MENDKASSIFNEIKYDLNEPMIKNEPLENEYYYISPSAIDSLEESNSKSFQETMPVSYSQSSFEQQESIDVMIKEEPLLEIEDYYYSLDSQQSNDTELEPASLEASSQENRKPPRKSKDKAINGQCNICSYKATQKMNLMHHFRRRHPGIKRDVTFKCNDCDLLFSSTNEVAQHSKVVHKTTKYMFGLCKLCQSIFSSRSAMLQHFRKAHPGCEYDYEYKCQQCDDFLVNKEEYTRHLLQVHNKVKFKTRCNLCKKVFSQEGKMKSHFEKYHPGFELKPDYQCNQCDDFFNTLDEAMIHAKLPHNLPDNTADMSPAIFFRKVYKKLIHTQCNICKLTCHTYGSLKTHFEKCHPGSEPKADYKCKECDEFFEIPHDCFEHTKQAHNAEEKLKPGKSKAYNYNKRINARCNVCKGIFCTNATLKTHFRDQHKNCELKPDYKCKECDEFFDTTLSVRLHSKLVHEGKEVIRSSHRLCRCNVCNQLFVTYDILKGHFEEFHPGFEFKPEFKCRYCGDFFKSLKDCRRHIEAAHKSEKSSDEPTEIPELRSKKPKSENTVDIYC